MLKRLDFESGNFRQWNSIQAEDRSRLAIVRSPRIQGRFAARFLLRPGDVSASGERAEVLSKTGERAGVESWWKWSTLFPKSFRPIVGSHNVFTNWHHDGSTCQSPVSFRVNAWEQPAHIEFQLGGGHLNPATCQTTSGGRWNIGRLVRGRWQTFVVHVKWSAGKTGSIQVWRNGRKVVDKRRTATLYEGHSVYVKQGYYRRPATWPAIVYHDGLRRYSSRPRLR